MTAVRTAPDQVDDFARQEIRIAAVLNGGVSLAVWMSGVAIELHHLAMASQGLGRWPTYRAALDKLAATARVDVIAGTSAGGLNGVFLALGLARRRDFGLLRDLWCTQGSLEKLMRAPLAKNPPSPLAGDDFFLPAINAALASMVAAENPDLDQRAEKVAMPPVELILTGTLWQGRETRFTDDMGVGITERDYNATFRFASGEADGAELPEPVGNLDDPTPELLGQLAAAARCTSSFPAAFEPHWVEVADPLHRPGRWSSSGGQSNFDTSQYVIDGGVLLNKPLRPALESIYKQTAQNQVRRVLGYIVPDPGEPAAATTARTPAGKPDTPVAGEVLLGVLTRLTSTDSVSRELAEIRDTNATVRGHRRARARLGEVMAGAGATMAATFWPGYLDERILQAAAAIAIPIASSQPPGPAAWSVQELGDGLARVGRAKGFGFVPRGTLDDALAATGGDWAWGQTTLGRLADMTVDVFKRALVLAPISDADTQGKLVQARVAISAEVGQITAYARDLDRFWHDAARTGQPPARELAADPDGTPGVGSATNQPALDTWLEKVTALWDQSFGGDDGSKRRGEQYKGAIALAGALVDAREAVGRTIDRPNPSADPTGTGVGELRALYDWLLPAGVDAGEVLRRMLLLDVVLMTTSGALADPEQEVELVQLSCANRANITGMQLHHFGAFYRAPWRVNDWIEGRLDGSRQLMRLLLDPDRLRQLGYTAAQLFDALHEVAVPADHRDKDWLEQRWSDNADAYRAEIDDALGRTGSSTSLDLVSEAAAMPVRLDALGDDLDALAQAIRDEGDDTMSGSAGWLRAYDAAVATAPHPQPGRPASSAMSADVLWTLRKKMTDVGSELIQKDYGSDTFARTVSHAAVVVTGAFSNRLKVGHLKPVRVTVSALRGYVAMVYAMVAYLTRRSAVGTRAVELAVAVGAVLLAVSVFVPGVPIGLTLVGVLLLLAAVSASALLTTGIRGMGLRVLSAVVVVGVVFGYLLWRQWHESDGFHGEVVSVTVKVVITLGLVLFGWFVANGGATRRKRR